MKICFIIPFYYKWNTFANVRATYEYLQMNGHEVDLFSKKESKGIVNFNYYDVVMLHGSGSFLTKNQWMKCTKLIFGFGWSDPNLFNDLHFAQSNIYFTNNLQFDQILMIDRLPCKPVYYYQTACDKRYHKNLNLEKTTEILVYGTGNHQFVTNRNQIVAKLRHRGFQIKVFGRGWDKHPDTHGFIEGQTLIEEINKAKIVLDLSNETTSWAHRILEASACGTPVITYDREDTKQMFNEEEIFIYKTFEELQSQLHTLIQLPTLLEEVGKKAQTRCYKDHDISVRIKGLEAILKEINQ